ncbi:carboxypeptidase M32 [Candidatus Nomurabacteria bacterium]|nr:carboxypeptidase M32 [Candidatus Nomurabacteria bacterium]
MNNKNIANIYKKFMDEILVVQDFSSAIALMNWDQEVLMPEDGFPARSRTYATIADFAHKLTNSKSQIGRTLKLLEHKNNLSELQNRCLDKYHEEAKRSWKLSSKLVKDLAETTLNAQSVWSEAKEKNRFDLFAPYLQRIIDLKREEANQIGYSKNPYDALLDEYEPGLCCDTLDNLFDALLPSLKRIREEVLQKEPSQIEKHPRITKEKQFTFIKDLISKIGFDFNKGRVDLGKHPATEFIHENDVRIIAVAKDNNISTGIFLTLHECGHALYYQNTDMKYIGTNLYCGSSTVLHEALARLLENNIGKSRSFWEGCYSNLIKHSGIKGSEYSIEDFVWSINKISSSPIRFEADEISYVFHIYIRYLIEKRLIEGSLTVEEVPGLWRTLFQEYLDVPIANDSTGCLQDVHWACGLIGYFPTYFVGSIYAAQIYSVIKNQYNSFDDDLENSKYSGIINWLKVNIYAHGAYYTPKELLFKLTGNESLSYHDFENYLTNKYKSLNN